MTAVAQCGRETVSVWLVSGMKREYEGTEWGDAKRQRGTGPYVEIRVLLPSRVRMPFSSFTVQWK